MIKSRKQSDAEYSLWLQENRDIVKGMYEKWKKKNHKKVVKKIKKKNLRRCVVCDERLTGNKQILCSRKKCKKIYTKGKRSEIHISVIRRMLEESDDTCAICEKPMITGIHIDHKIPVSLLYRMRISTKVINDYINLQFTCPSCNIEKRDRILPEYEHLIPILIELDKS